MLHSGGKGRVALTGGSGFIGSRILALLLKENYSVIALQSRTPLPLHDNLITVNGGLDDAAALSRLVEGAQTVIHCAGLVAARNEADFFAVNEAGTARLARAAAQAGAERFLLLSSLAARLPEISSYAASKRAGESALQSACGARMRWDILRPPAVYGPEDQQFARMLSLLKAGFALVPAGPQAQVSLIHADDLAGAVLYWVEAGRAQGKVYEIDDGAPQGHSWGEVMRLAAGLIGKKPVFLKPPRALLRLAAIATGDKFLSEGKIREICHPDWVCRHDLYQNETGWRPAIGLQNGLEKSIQAVSGDGGAVNKV